LDGCTDGTKNTVNAVLHKLGMVNAAVVERLPQQGKVRILNEQIALTDSEIVALTDASASVPSDALLRGVRHFADRRVGVVCATYTVPRAGTHGESRYWRYQNRIKADEATLGAPMGAHGAFYMFRRSFWTPLPADTINDDFALPMQIVREGYCAVYDETIVIAETESSALRQEIWRRVRMGAGNLQQALRFIGLANPTRPGVAFVFVSGKGLRGIMPLLLLTAMSSCALLAYLGSSVHQYLLIAQLAVLCFLALTARDARKRLPAWAHSLLYLAIGHAASGVGAMLFVFRTHDRAWRWSSAQKLSAARARLVGRQR
jgi:cellulose synthase/poly-beta-1,6-N-acetylglucosamine synthase-like glycosyltransferase